MNYTKKLHATNAQAVLESIPADCYFPLMSGGQNNQSKAALSRELILKALQALSDELGRHNVAGYYPANRVPVKAQFLVEGLFAEGKI